MIVEAGVVAGYVIAWAGRKARRVGGRMDREVDRAVDAALDRLHEAVAAKLGGHPVLAEIVEEAEDAGGGGVSDLTHQEAEAAIARAAAKDEAFGQAVTDLLAGVRKAERAAGATAEAKAEGNGIAIGQAGTVNIERVAGHDLITENHYHLAGRPPESQVELVDVAIGQPGRAPGDRDESPVLDVKVRNTGGQLAVLKRVVVHVHRAVRCGNMSTSMRLAAYRETLYGAVLPVSATYDVSIPVPEEAIGAAVGASISQVVAPGEADRFEVRLGMEPTFDGYAYQVSLELIYDGDDRSVASAPVAVAFPSLRNSR